MKNNLIKSLLISSLILRGVWNHEVAHSSDDPSQAVVPYGAGLSSNRGVTPERAEEILKRFVELFEWYEDFEGYENIDNQSKKVMEEWTKAKLLPVCSEKEFVNITITAHELEAEFDEIPTSGSYVSIYDLYRKRFLGEVSNKPGLYITEWCKKLTKEVIKQIYGMYDLLKHRVLNVVNEDDITEDDYLKVYQRSEYEYKYECSDSREERDSRLKKDIEDLKKEKDEMEIKNIVEKYKGYYREYQSLFYNTSSNLEARVELLDYYWGQDCSAFDEFNDLLVEMIRSSRFFDKEYYDDWKKNSNTVDDIRLAIYDFLHAYPFDNEDLFETICEELEQEYKPKDDLVLAYCNYHFSNENGNLQSLFEYFEGASLSNPIFIRDIMQYAKQLSPSYDYLDNLKKFISLMESNHCAPSLKQFFKEPLDMEEQERQDNRKKAKEDDEEVKRYEWLYLITGENPPTEEEYDKVLDGKLINLLRERKYTDALMLYNVANKRSREELNKQIATNFTETKVRLYFNELIQIAKFMRRIKIK